MGKRKSLNIQRVKWMNEGKKRRKEEVNEEVVMVEEQIEEEEVVVVEEQIEEKVQHVVGYAEAQNDDGNEQVEEMDEDEEQMDGLAPKYVYIEGVAIPTKDLADPRNGDGMVLELDSEDGDPYLAEFNGHYHDLHQIVGAVWQKGNVDEQITVGHTNGNPKSWASRAKYLGLKFVAHPTMRTTICRSVITAINAGLTIEPKKAFSFKIYVRSMLLAEKVKGFVRHVTDCIHKGEAVDDTNALVPFHHYIECKILNAMEQLPTINQTSIFKHLRHKGWIQIVNID